MKIKRVECEKDEQIRDYTANIVLGFVIADTIAASSELNIQPLCWW